MRVGLLFLTLFLCIPTSAQTPVDTATNSNDAAPPATLKRREAVSEVPTAKIIEKDHSCAVGSGKPCAALDGRLYFSDSRALSQRSKSWTAAATSRSMLVSLGLLSAATVADIESTQSCIHAGACKEGNPLMGQSRAQEYSVAMSINALAFWATAEQRRHSRGVVPFSILFGASAMHATLAAHNCSLGAK